MAKVERSDLVEQGLSQRVDLENREHVLPRLEYGDEMGASRTTNGREMN